MDVVMETHFGVSHYQLYKKIPLTRGIYFGISIALIFITRFFIEFVRERQVEFEEQIKLDMAQILSLPLIFAAIACTFYGFRRSQTLP
jgi:phosphatidylglycerol---prolipoprotein diacylglyceryl transferase